MPDEFDPVPSTRTPPAIRQKWYRRTSVRRGGGWAAAIIAVVVLIYFFGERVRTYAWGPKTEQLAEENDSLKAQNTRLASGESIRQALVRDSLTRERELRDSLQREFATRLESEDAPTAGPPTKADARRAVANRRTAARGTRSTVRVSLQRDGCLKNRAVAWPAGLTLTPYTANPANAHPKAVVWAVCDRPATSWEDVQIGKLVYIWDPTVECMAGGCQPPDVVALCGWRDPVDDGRTYGYCDNTESLTTRFTFVGDNLWELSAANFPVGTLRDGDIYIYRGAVGTHTRGFVNTGEWMAYLPDTTPVVAVVPFLVYDEVAGTRGNLSNHTVHDVSLAGKYNANPADMVARICIRKDAATGAMRPCIDEQVLCVLVHDRQADAFSVVPLPAGKVCYDPTGPGLARYFNTWRPKIRNLNPNIASR